MSSGGSVSKYINFKPLKVICCLITLMAFLFNILSFDVAWALKTSSSGLNKENVNAASVPSLNELNVDTFTLPVYLGRVTIRTKGDGHTIILHIQDAHCNYAAQHVIAKIIDYLTRHYAISAINLEGGAKDYDLGMFTRIQDRKIREVVADDFLKEGLVSGAEYFAINNPGKVSLWGVEDAELYLENLNIYREFLKHKNAVDAHLKNISTVLSGIKINTYSDKLLELDTKYLQYKAGNIELKVYLSYLIDTAMAQGVDIKAFRNIDLLRLSLIEEEKVDFDRANNERDRLVNVLQKSLSNFEMEELVLKTLEFKTEKISWEGFYGYLVKKAKAVNIDISGYGELQKYIAYISLYGEVDKARVVEEMDALESKLKDLMCKNEAEHELNLLSKNLAITKNLFGISLTKEDYKYYKDNEDSFRMNRFLAFIGKQAAQYRMAISADRSISEVDVFRDDMTKFYECSLKRDQAFIKNIRFTGREHKVALLVTGGFHTDNLSVLFRKNNTSYVSIMPNYRNDKEIDCRYFNLLAGEIAGLEKRLYSVMSHNPVKASLISIAPILSRLIAMRVWGPDMVDAVQAAVYLDSLLREGKSVRINVPGRKDTGEDELMFGDGSGEVVEISADELAGRAGGIQSQVKPRGTAVAGHEFTCGNCKRAIPPLKSGYRDHCTYCLWSRHLDDVNPGDRLSKCKGLMQPVGIQHNGRKGWQIIYRCTRCQATKINVAAPDDDWEAIVNLSLPGGQQIEPAVIGALAFSLPLYFWFGLNIASLIGIAAFALLAHEFAHKKVLNWVGVSNTHLKFTMLHRFIPALGVAYDTDDLDKLPNWKTRKALVTIAGPLANIALVGVFIGIGAIFDAGLIGYFVRFAIIANAVMATFGSVVDFQNLYKLRNAKTAGDMAVRPASTDNEQTTIAVVSDAEVRETKAVTRRDVVSLVASSDSLWLGFMDMAKAGLRNSVCGRDAMDLVIEEVLDIVALELSAKYDGKVFKIGGDEIGFAMPSTMSSSDVHKALVGVQVALRDKFSDKQFLEQLLHRMRNEGVDEASIEKFRNGAYIPFEPAGCVRLNDIPKKIASDNDTERIKKANTLLTENMKYAETVQGYAKEEQGGLVELVKVIEDFSEPKKTVVSILSAEEEHAVENARKNMGVFGLETEEEYAALNRSSLWEAVNLAAKQIEPAVYFARGPPDAFYVIRACGNGKVQVIKISSEYIALNKKTQRAFNKVLKDSGREPRKRDSDTIKYYGFKSPQDASRIYEKTGHERGNDWIKLLNLGIYETFTPSDKILSEIEILRKLNQASRLLNSHTVIKNNARLSFRVVFDASTASTEDVPPDSKRSVAGTLMPAIEQLDETRNSAIRSGVAIDGFLEARDSSRGKTSPEVKAYKNNIETWDNILEENELARQARARRAREELIDADRKLNDSLTVVLEQNGMLELVPYDEAAVPLEGLSIQSQNQKNLEKALKGLSEDRKKALKEKIEMAIEEHADVDEVLAYLEDILPGIYYQGYGLADVASVVGGGRAAALVNINETGKAFLEDSRSKGGAILRSQGIAVNMVFNPHINHKMYGTYYRSFIYDIGAVRKIIDQDQNLALLRKHLGKQQDIQLKKDMSDRDIEKLMQLLLSTESPLQGLFLGYPRQAVAMFMEPARRAGEGFGLNDFVEQITGKKGTLKPFTGFITSEALIDESLDSAIAAYKGWARCATLLRAMQKSYAPEDFAIVLKHDFETKLAELKSRSGEKGFSFNEAYADLIDSTLRKLSDIYQFTDRLTIVAMGSYARRGCPYGTDIDIFLLEKEGAGLIPADVERFIKQAKNITGIGFDYPAYPDAPDGRPIAHYLTLSKYKESFSELDRISLRCLLDMRYVSGPEQSFADLKKLSKKSTRKLLTEYLPADIRDLKKNFEKVFDPNNFQIKKGRAGSRTINIIMWLGREKLDMAEWDWEKPGAVNELLNALAKNKFLSDAEAKALGEAQNFLLRLRTAVNIVWERPEHIDAYEDGDLKDTFTKEIVGEVADILGMPEKEMIAEIIRHNHNVQKIVREFVIYDEKHMVYDLDRRIPLGTYDIEQEKAKVNFEIRNSKQLVEKSFLRLMGISHGDLEDNREYREGELDDYTKAFKEGRIFAALVNGEIAGYCLISRKDVNAIVIEELVVLPEYQNVDIGTSLVDSAITAYAIDSGFVSMAPLTDAKRFYEKYFSRRGNDDDLTRSRGWWLEPSQPDKPGQFKAVVHKQAGENPPISEIDKAPVPDDAKELYGTAKEVAPLIVDILRKGSPTVVIEPAASLDEVSPLAGLFRKAEQRTERKQQEICAESYLADVNWMSNLKATLQKVLPDFAAVAINPKNRARMLIQLVAVDRKSALADEGALREFITKFLVENGHADINTAENIMQRIRFSRLDIGHARYSNSTIDLLRDVMMLEIDRYGQDDGYPGDEVPPSLAEMYLRLLRQSITNFDALTLEAMKFTGEISDVRKVLRAIFEGYILQAKAIDWESIREWKRANDEVLMAL